VKAVDVEEYQDCHKCRSRIAVNEGLRLGDSMTKRGCLKCEVRIAVFGIRARACNRSVERTLAAQASACLVAVDPEGDCEQRNHVSSREPFRRPRVLSDGGPLLGVGGDLTTQNRQGFRPLARDPAT